MGRTGRTARRRREFKVLVHPRGLECGRSPWFPSPALILLGNMHHIEQSLLTSAATRLEFSLALRNVCDWK